jgi:hypothetical protein
MKMFFNALDKTDDSDRFAKKTLDLPKLRLWKPEFFLLKLRVRQKTT